MFPNLRAEMARRRISAKQLSEKLGITSKTFENKMNGSTDFKLGEMREIRYLFPDCSYEYLFEQGGGDDVQVNQAPV